MNVIAIANQKGGCGRTTTAINLAACLGCEGGRVLLIDMDAQGHASLGLGVPVAALPGLYEVFAGSASLMDVIIYDAAAGVDLIPGALNLTALEQRLTGGAEREKALRKLLEPVAGYYDYIIVDCPPGLGVLCDYVLRAAARVLAPVELSPYTLDGVVRLRKMIERITDHYGLTIQVNLLPSAVEPCSRLAQRVLAQLQARWPAELTPLTVRATVKVKEAAYAGRALIAYAPRAAVTADFAKLAQWISGAPPASRRAVQIPAASAVRVPGVTVSESMEKAGERRVVLSYHHFADKDMQIAGEFNDWIPDYEVETHTVKDTMQKVLKVSPGAYQYRVVIDGKWQEDPVNPLRVPNAYGGNNSLLRVLP